MITLKDLEEICKEARSEGVKDNDVILVRIKQECHNYLIDSKDDIAFIKVEEV